MMITATATTAIVIPAMLLQDPWKAVSSNVRRHVPEGVHIHLELSEGLLSLVGISLSPASLSIGLHHPVHILTHLRAKSQQLLLQYLACNEVQLQACQA